MLETTLVDSGPGANATPAGKEGDTRTRAALRALRPGRAFLVAAALLATTAIVGPQLWCALSPRMAVSRAGYTNRSSWRTSAQDPWGRSMRETRCVRVPGSHFHSMGPDGVDDDGGGDDVVALPVRHPALVLIFVLRPLAAGLLGMLALARLLAAAPLAPTIPHELFRTSLVAFLPIVVTPGVLGLLEDTDLERLRRWLDSRELWAPLPLPVTLHLLVSWAGLVWLLALAARLARRS